MQFKSEALKHQSRQAAKAAAEDKYIQRLKEEIRELSRDNYNLERENERLKSELYKTFSDIQRVLYYATKFEDREYPPLKRLLEKYSDLNAPYAKRDYEFVRDDEVTGDVM
jgi:endo-1,4-beta-D-glucanase Y